MSSRNWADISRCDTVPGALEEPVGERRLAVVDVGDDREVADAGRVQGRALRTRGRIG